MKKFVIDSCVFMKLFLDEEDSEIAEKLIAEISKNGQAIYVPSIFIYEITNVASSKKLDIRQVFSILEKHKKSALKIIEPTYEILHQATKIAQSGNAKSGYPSIYDCSYHALAINLSCDFITSDSKHFAKTKQLGSIKLLKDYA